MQDMICDAYACSGREMIVVPLLVSLFWVEPGDEFVDEEPIEYAY